MCQLMAIAIMLVCMIFACILCNVQQKFPAKHYYLDLYIRAKL